MKVLLTKDIPSVGRAGDVVVVADGYARNYLIPRNLAIKATPGSLKNAQALRDSAATRRAEEDAASRELYERLSGLSCEFTAAADENGHLYGGISEREIAASLEEKGLEVDRRDIVLEQHIKTTGTFQVPVRISPELTSEITIVVNPETQEE